MCKINIYTFASIIMRYKIMDHNSTTKKTPIAMILLVAFGYGVAILMTINLLYLVSVGKF